MLHTKSFEHGFALRSAVCFFVILLMFLSCILRVAVTATGNYSEVQARQSAYILSASGIRGTIFDCNMIPLTNKSTRIIAAVSPTPRAITGIRSVLSGDSLDSVLEGLKSGKPVLCEVPEEISCDGIICTKIYVHSDSDTQAIHLIGTTDSTMHGVSGLERAYDEILYSENKTEFVYTCDGLNDILRGIAPELRNDTAPVGNGVVTTLDSRIQSIAETASSELSRGAVIVCESNTGKIRAMVSRPDYDCTDIASYLDREDSPLLNRAVAAYNVGSVFKPCVAAAAIESGKQNYTCVCTGGAEIDGRLFRCHVHTGHGFVNLKSAIALSCNTFFYRLAIKTGAAKIYETAASLGFGEPQRIAQGLMSAAGNLPSPESLGGNAGLANLCIGQGELLVSPVAMLNLYNAVACGGAYRTTSVVEGTVEGGRLTEYRSDPPTRVMSAETSAMLREYLAEVITSGTGGAARPSACTAAGKTATAQTGKFRDGREICEGWFCGFFPAENPEYTVVVFSEDVSLSGSTAGIFASIADGITSDRNQN